MTRQEGAEKRGRGQWGGQMGQGRCQVNGGITSILELPVPRAVSIMICCWMDEWTDRVKGFMIMEKGRSMLFLVRKKK